MSKTLQKLLPFFDPKELPDYPFIFIVSARRSGKSTVVCDLLLNYFQDYDFRIGLMGNAHTAQHYIKCGALPADYVHTSYRPKILKDWFKTADRLMRKGKTLPSTVFVCDDVLQLTAEKGRVTTRRDPYLNKLATAGRHYRAACILIVQSVSVALNFVRNSDVVMCAPSSLFAGQDYKALTELYMTGDFRHENKELLEYFGRFDFLVLRYWKASRNQRDLLAYYRVSSQSLNASSKKSYTDRIDIGNLGGGGKDGFATVGVES